MAIVILFLCRFSELPIMLDFEDDYLQRGRDEEFSSMIQRKNKLKEPLKGKPQKKFFS